MPEKYRITARRLPETSRNSTFRRHLAADETEKWGRVIRAANVKVQ
jgi:hypothetical protein